MWLETVKGCKDWKQICYYKCEKGSNLLFCNLSFFFFFAYQLLLFSIKIPSSPCGGIGG